MKRMTLAICLLLLGCGKPLSNEQIITVAKQCKAAGLSMVESENWKAETVAVQCRNPIYW